MIFEYIKSVISAMENSTDVTFLTYCPPILDEFLIFWPATSAGETANQTCPLNTKNLVYKECQDDGSWMPHPNSSDTRPWTNITSCINFEEYEFSMLLNRLYVWGYSISLIPLFVSLFIFTAFKALRCTRIRIHTQLFLSIFLNNILWIIWYTEIVEKSRESWLLTNPVWCQVVYVLKTYFMVCTYFWMFCEALYLLRTLVIVFVIEEFVVWLCLLCIGWLLPLLIVVYYALVRMYIIKNTALCWSESSDSATNNWILIVPIAISLLSSFACLVYILGVIMAMTNSNPVMDRLKKATRAALLLIPLFGLHFLLIPMRPDPGDGWVKIYEFTSVILISLQGIPVSVLFCFVNQDVHQAIRAYVSRRLYVRRCSNYPYSSTPMECSSRPPTTTSNSKQVNVTYSCENQPL